MIGQCFSQDRFNVIILAAGAGTRMGESSAYIPKALLPLGEMRAIDWIIYRYRNVAEKFIIGVYTHKDLLINYLEGRYPHLNIEFAVEQGLENNARSTTICLDHADSRFPTLIHFCDLLMLDNFELRPDQLFYADYNTQGCTGTFRHVWNGKTLSAVAHPINLRQRALAGLMGVFSIGDTPKLKGILYSKWDRLYDITENGIFPYLHGTKISMTHCKKVIEFGNDADFRKAREMWETI